jgi:membrane protein YdbS with pleckstrin-like domain
MGKQKKTLKDVAKHRISPFKDYWTKSNYFILVMSISAIIIGYFLMGQGNWDSTSSLLISPIILVIAYVIIVPLSIFYKQKNTKQNNNVSS